MPRKRKIEPLPQDARLVQFRPGELKPLFVKAADIGKVVVGLSPKTMANWRSQGIGPRYHLVNGSVYYGFGEIEGFFGKNLIETADEL
ncbi:MAG: hypothetical protein HOB18_10115 [Nitrospina sp.]|jgi:hypothetical protein|nr:hypothetical protein [Nitrospina sp.]